MAVRELVQEELVIRMQVYTASRYQRLIAEGGAREDGAPPPVLLPTLGPGRFRVARALR